MINRDKIVGHSLVVSILLLFSWQSSTLGQESNTDELITKSILASEQNNQSSQSKSPELCSITTEPKQDATVPEYMVPIAIAVRNRPVSIKVKGNTILSSEEVKTEIAQIFQPQTERQLTIAEFNQKLERVAQAITKIYRDRGYITSQAKTPQGLPKIADEGIVGEIDVIEARLVKIKVEGRERLNLSYICNRIGLGVGTPFNFNQLEEQLRLLRLNPLFETLNASLRPTGKRGESTLVISAIEANPLIVNLGVDNYSPPSVGSERWGVGLGSRNLTGLGDEILATYYRSTSGGSDNLDVTYRVPLNSMNGTLLLRAAPEWRRITQSPFDDLDIKGEKERYEISYRQPFVRTSREEFAFSLGFSYQDDETSLFDRPFSFTFGPDEGKSRTRVIQFGQDYIRRDGDGAWSLRSQFNFGTGLFDATANSGSAPDGNFFAWLFQMQRVQVLGTNNLLIISADLQLTPDPLLPNQQFIIGGGQSVRGYRQNVRAGDNGFRFSIEDRITLARNEDREVFQLAPFVDMGDVWNISDNPNRLPSQTFLIGAGIGLLWEPLEDFRIRLDYGAPIIDLDDRGDNVQDNGFYFSVNYRL